MCVRKEGEALIPYLLRYIQEQPRVVMAFVAMACAVGVYLDMRCFVDNHMEALKQVAVELRTVSTRLEHLERVHEKDSK